jgi:hypothetical protein
MSVANAESVEIEVDDITYQASYFVWKDVVTVEYDGEEKSTQVGNTSADIVACQLLCEMVLAKSPRS